MALKDLVRRRTVASTPAPIENSIATEGMDGSTSFGPGRPINPFFGYSTRPRAFDYPVGANITTRPREAYGRMSFGFMKTLIDAYWLAGACIDHKIKNLQSMELLFSPAEGVDYDVTGAIKAARAALAFPDRELPFESWLSKWLEGVFRYDAGCLYRRRDRAGRVIGLEVVDGSTVAPYIDEHGRRPRPPAPAYAQLIKGVPGYWLTSDDLIYTPFRPQVDSPYGRAPIEAIQINANTDLRFQMWCLQYFTSGSLPGGFLNAPESVSTPDQVQQWQDFWDALMIGDQEALRQIKVIPHDMKFQPVRDPTFDERFPLHLARITCAAYGVVPQDLGITMDVNRAVGETQLDVQFRINDRPVMMFAQNILTNYVQRDLGLPVAISFDDGQAKEDRLHEAQAWQIYTNSGYASVDEARAKLLGLPVDPSRPVPRIILDPRIGPVPLSSIEAVSGKINPHSLSPSADAPLPQITPDTAAPAIVANKASGEPAAPSNPEPPQFIPAPKHPADGTPSVANPEAVAKATEGIAAETGLEGVDLLEDDEDEQKRAELATFGRFVKTRARKGVWRDFDFIRADRVTAHRLNDEGRTQILKAAGQIVAAGLAVQADNTGRVLLIQRALDEDDPAGGMFEFPGGHVETGETPKQAAYREWQEETGILLPYVPESPDLSWSNGVYEGFVWRVPTELPLADRNVVSNPDDPDGDNLEAICWVAPEDLSSMPLRRELRASLDDVLAVLDTSLAKAASGDPKARPASRFEQQLVAHWTRMLQSAIRTLTPVATLAAQLVAMFAATADAIIESAVAASIRIDRDVLSSTLKALYADGYVAGAKDVTGQASKGSLADELARIDWEAWAPGKTAPTKLAADPNFEALADQIAQRVTGIDETTRNLIAQTVRDGVAGHKPTGRIADDIEAVLVDPKRARLIAVTEINRAMSAGAMAMYRANGIEAWDLITAPDPCPICQAIKDANPHPIGDTQIPPEHPACRCAVAAHVEV